MTFRLLRTEDGGSSLKSDSFLCFKELILFVWLKEGNNFILKYAPQREKNGSYISLQEQFHSYECRKDAVRGVGASSAQRERFDLSL